MNANTMWAWLAEQNVDSSHDPVTNHTLLLDRVPVYTASSPSTLAVPSHLRENTRRLPGRTDKVFSFHGGKHSLLFEYVSAQEKRSKKLSLICKGTNIRQQ